MTEVRVESKTFYSKPTLNKDHIAESAQEWAQATIDDYLAGGWRLASTDATSFGAAVYVFLYFEREV
ncbi:MAG: DUF4177 domain-containing protein [Bacteroidota bacterium]